ncbi:hypothetical protein E2542_SST31035 [Spatholobus suberectus]|nr:hypothetical protein E2542_SST31035 [Spatholobus suberectus]
MEEKRMTHYCSSHRILLVGEGDFSFSLCLARAFGTAKNMVATSLDSKRVLELSYKNASMNLTELEALGCTIAHEVNVRTMIQHSLLKYQKFDRIIYNFPHAGFVGRERDEHQIQLHKELVSGFLKNAKHMLTSNGEIHITHKTTHPFNLWNITELAQHEGLVLVREEMFDQHLYPGYNIKRGAGSRCVTSVALDGDDNDRVAVIGVNVDLVCVVNMLKKKFCSVIILRASQIWFGSKLIGWYKQVDGTVMEDVGAP